MLSVPKGTTPVDQLLPVFQLVLVLPVHTGLALVTVTVNELAGELVQGPALVTVSDPV